ncbi:MAG: prephenate dehydrogenase/arogenate dehydrogenase family protein [Caldilineaceae bacterium]|nr:prephenate dehydrogenase/arogenate dehydrogenase family protein [Caldilineaceae bacterium]
MAKPKITIIGLDVIGASLGLGLQREPGNFEIVGHDKDAEHTGRARQLQAVHRTEWNLHNACDGAELILLTLSLPELEETLPHLREDLRPETLVFAITNAMQPTIDLAAKQLAPETHFVVGHPILTGIDAPLTVRADLFHEATFGLAPGLHTDPSAVQLASDFVERLGATPLFVDAHEHDGIIAGVEHLPQLVAAALVHLSAGAAGWREARRLAGRTFAQSTELDGSASQLFGTFLNNRANLLQRIDQLQQELIMWRDLLNATPADEEKHPLLSTLEQIVQQRELWEAQAMLKRWDEPATPSAAPEARGMFRQMFFGNMGGRKTDRKNQK